MSKIKHQWNFQNVQGVGGSFLVLDGHPLPTIDGRHTHAHGGEDVIDVLDARSDALRFFVGARSGSCNGCTICTETQLRQCALNGNASAGVASLRRDGFASLTVVAPEGGSSDSGVLRTRAVQFERGSRGNFLFVNVALAKTAGALMVASR